MGLFSKVLKPITNLVSDVVGGTVNAATGVSHTAKQSYNQSLALMDKENANNIKLWNMQNEYNTPSAQIARMKEAGVDVNPMTYAVGNGNMSSTASSISSANPHMPSYSGAGNPISALMNVLNGVEEYKSRKLNNRILANDVKTYEDTGIRPSSDGLSQLARVFSTHFPQVFSTHFPQVISALKGRLSKGDSYGVSLLDAPKPGDTEAILRHNARAMYYKKYGKFPD